MCDLPMVLVPVVPRCGSGGSGKIQQELSGVRPMPTLGAKNAPKMEHPDVLLRTCCDHTLVVFAGGVAHQIAEVVDEVCLVGVTQIERELGAVEGMA